MKRSPNSRVSSPTILKLKARTYHSAVFRGSGAFRWMWLIRNAMIVVLRRELDAGQDLLYIRRSVHDEAAVDAQRLPRHVARLARHEKADHARDVLGTLHPPEWDLRGALARELLGREPHQLALLARDVGPHVGLHEAGAHAVHPDPVGRVCEGEALRHADDGGLARVVGEGVAVADLARHGRQADARAAPLRDHSA